MSNQTPAPTQTKYPARAVARTIFQAAVGFAAMSPFIYTAATHNDPAQATGWAAGALVITGAVTRILAVPAVNAWLATFLPFLAAAPKPEGE